MKLFILAALCILIGCAQQIESVPEQVPDVSTKPVNRQTRDVNLPAFFDLDDIPTTPIRYKSKVSPVYPEQARVAKKGGKVVIELTVDENGMPKDIKPVTNLGYGLEDAVITAIQQTTFYPAMQGKRPVRKRIEITMMFSYETGQ